MIFEWYFEVAFEISFCETCFFYLSPGEKYVGEVISKRWYLVKSSAESLFPLFLKVLSSDSCNTIRSDDKLKYVFDTCVKSNDDILINLTSVVFNKVFIQCQWPSINCFCFTFRIGTMTIISHKRSTRFHDLILWLPTSTPASRHLMKMITIAGIFIK